MQSTGAYPKASNDPPSLTNREAIDNNLISANQHGFLSRKSCVTNLLETLDTITESINGGFGIVTVLLDFSKAFDMVPHEELLLKIEAYGIKGNLLEWLTDFLIGRKQRVIIGKATSDWRPVSSGVPQGSVLGPLLFLIYINDMPDALNHICKLFADDSKLIGVIKNSNDTMRLQEDLDKLSNWVNEWRMKFNYDKCKIMTIGKKLYDVNRPFVLTDVCNGTNHDLIETASERDLGIQMTNDLKWTEQTQMAVNKATRVLAMLRKAFVFWDVQTTKRLYIVFVRPHLEYAASVWNPCAKKDIKSLEKVQRRVTKFPANMKNLKYEERLRRFNLTTLVERRERGDAIQFFKFNIGINTINWQHPIGQKIRGNTDGPASSVRGIEHRLTSESTNCRARANFFGNRVVSIWNKTPKELWQAKSVNGFKNAYDKNTKRLATMSESLMRQAPANE